MLAQVDLLLGARDDGDGTDLDGSTGGYDILFGLGFVLMLSCLILALFALRNARWANCTQ